MTSYAIVHYHRTYQLLSSPDGRGLEESISDWRHTKGNDVKVMGSVHEAPADLASRLERIVEDLNRGKRVDVKRALRILRPSEAP